MAVAIIYFIYPSVVKSFQWLQTGFVSVTYKLMTTLFLCWLTVFLGLQSTLILLLYILVCQFISRETTCVSTVIRQFIKSLCSILCLGFVGKWRITFEFAKCITYFYVYASDKLNRVTVRKGFYSVAPMVYGYIYIMVYY